MGGRAFKSFIMPPVRFSIYSKILTTELNSSSCAKKNYFISLFFIVSFFAFVSIKIKTKKIFKVEPEQVAEKQNKNVYNERNCGENNL